MSNNGEVMNGARTNTEREKSKDKDREDGGCKYHSSNKTKFKSNQTMVVKHCQAFQISVTHTRETSKHTTTNTHHPETDQKVKQGHLFERKYNEEKLSLLNLCHKGLGLLCWGLQTDMLPAFFTFRRKEISEEKCFY